MELRCENGIRFADLDDGVLEVKCRSARCGAAPGIVVLHRFDALTGELLDTKRFRDPAAVKERSKTSGTEHNSDSVRIA